VLPPGESRDLSTPYLIVDFAWPWPTIWANMASSRTKPEVHKVSQRRQRRTEPQPRATCAENLLKFERVSRGIFLADRQTDRQTCLSQYCAVKSCIQLPVNNDRNRRQINHARFYDVALSRVANKTSYTGRLT